MAGTEISADVVARVAAKAALEVDGVVALENAPGDGIAAALTRDAVSRGVKTRGVKTRDVTTRGVTTRGGKTQSGKTRGVRAAQDKNGCVVQLSAVTAYGFRIPEVAWNIQTHVKNTLEEYLGINVTEVNVLIAGVRE